MTFHPTLFQVRYAEDLPPEGTEIPRGYGDLLYHFKEKRAESFPNCPEKNKHFTYELPIRTGIDYDNVYFFVILNTQSMRSTDTVKITMFGNSNTISPSKALTKGRVPEKESVKSVFFFPNMVNIPEIWST